MVCDCGAKFERALLIQTEKTKRVVCPYCKERGPRFEEPPEMQEGMTARFKLKDD